MEIFIILARESVLTEDLFPGFSWTVVCPSLAEGGPVNGKALLWKAVRLAWLLTLFRGSNIILLLLDFTPQSFRSGRNDRV